MEPSNTSPDGGPMLDVDGNVASAEALVRRVEQLIERIDADGGPDASAPTGLAAVVAPVHGMRALSREMHPPEVAGAGARGRAGSLVKKTVRRLTSWYVEPRFQVQEQIDAQAVEFAAEAYNTLVRMEAEIEELRLQNVRTRLEVVAAGERIRRQALMTEQVTHLEQVVRGAADQDELRVLSKEFATLLDRLGADTVSGVDLDYVEFERRFRGDPTRIAAAQRRYLSLFPAATRPGTIVDIGCGRGEMLAMLAEEGHEVLGVDMDAGMVQACLDQGLRAVQDDGLHFLAQTAPGSLKGIYCAQVVEHLLTTELEQLVRLSLDALEDDGVLVMETINPRSSYALGNHYYADTSHVRPVHPETLRFICEQVGFSRVALEERSPHPALDLREDLPDDAVGTSVQALLESVFGYQDYVIVANK
jgi:O-antigen chain-terminating methyltransferase